MEAGDGDPQQQDEETGGSEETIASNDTGPAASQACGQQGHHRAEEGGHVRHTGRFPETEKHLYSMEREPLLGVWGVSRQSGQECDSTGQTHLRRLRLPGETGRLQPPDEVLQK